MKFKTVFSKTPVQEKYNYFSTEAHTTNLSDIALCHMLYEQ